MLARVQVLLMHLHMTLWLRVSARVGRVIQAAEMLVCIGEMLCCQWSLPPPRWKAWRTSRWGSSGRRGTRFGGACRSAAEISSEAQS